MKEDSRLSASVDVGDVEAILNYTTNKSFIINIRKLSTDSNFEPQDGIAKDNLIDNSPLEAEDNFYIYKRIEICKLAKKLNAPSFTIIMIVMVLYLYLLFTLNTLLLENA